jgi:MYXO-CTERM domain-containing protein
MSTSKPSKYVHIAYRLLGGVLLCLFGLSVAAPSGAHSGKGSIKIVSREPAGPLAIHYVVAISFIADGHPASDAVATIVGESAGLRIGPVPLTPVAEGTGTYEATVIYPAAGAWDIRITSLDPTAVLLQAESLSPTVDTSAAPTSAPPVTPVQTDPDASTVPVESAPVESVPVESVPVDLPVDSVTAESGQSENSSRAWVIGAVGAGLLVAAAVWRRRAKRSSGRQ